MMKRSLLCRWLICLLAVALLPLQAVRAEGTDPRLVTVRAENLFENGFHTAELLLTGNRYYISPEEAGRLAGLTPEQSGSGLVFKGTYVSVPAALDSIPAVSFEGKTYYALEPVLKELQVYGIARDGLLVFNSVQGNLDRLLTVLKDVVISSRFDADYLRDLPVIGSLAYYLGKAYQSIEEFEFNPVANYEEDIRSLLIELVSPDEEDWEGRLRSLFLEGIGTANEKLSKAAEFILAAEEGYENLKEFLYDIPAGGDILLFDIEGTRYLREGLEAADAVNKDFFSDFCLRHFFCSDELADYNDAMEGLKPGSVSDDLDIYSLSDLIRMTKYYADVTTLDAVYIRTLDSIVNELSVPPTDDLILQQRRQSIINEAKKIVGDYRIHVNGNIGSAFASISEHFAEDVVHNLSNELLVNLDFWSKLKVQASVGIITFFIDWKGNTETAKKMNAITKMYEYKHIQDLIYDSLEKSMETPDPGKAEFYINAAILYLKCAWHAIDAFSYANLPKDGIPVNTMERTIEENMAKVLDFSSFEFRTADPEEDIPGGSLDELSGAAGLPEDSPFAPYLTIGYMDRVSFGSVWHGEISCSYEVPQVRETLACAAEANKRIMDGFRRYVTGRKGRYIIHGNTRSEFREPLDENEFSWTDPEGTILKDVSWEARIDGSILSLRITRSYYNTENLAFEFYDEYDVLNIDLASGQLLSSEELMQKLGIEEYQMRAWLEDGMSALAGAGSYYPDFEDEDWIAETLRENPYPDVLERGFYLSPDGMQVWVYVVSGSRYVYPEMLTLGCQGDGSVDNP